MIHRTSLGKQTFKKNYNFFLHLNTFEHIQCINRRRKKTHEHPTRIHKRVADKQGREKCSFSVEERESINQALWNMRVKQFFLIFRLRKNYFF